MFRIILIAAIISISFTTVQGETMGDIEAIKKTAMDYVESYYEGDAKKMKASLHKKLAKRSVKRTNGKEKLKLMTASDLISYTKRGSGRKLWQEGQEIEVIVLDIYKSIASVKVMGPHYYEYLHLAKIENQWVILNVLWDYK